MGEISLTDRVWAAPRRFSSGLLALGLLLLMAFYALVDSEQIAESAALQGADLIGYAVCHRLPEHSFTLLGRQMPLCARCTGMYLGATLVLAATLLAGRGRWAALPPRKVMLPLLSFLGLMGLDGLNSVGYVYGLWPHLYEPHNGLRLLSGMGAGLTLGALLNPSLAQALWQEPVWRPALGRLPELLGLVGLAGVLALLVASNQPPILYVLSMVSASGVLIALVAINTILLLAVTRRDGRAAFWWQAAGPLALGLLLAVMEIMAIDWVRWSLTGSLTGAASL